MQLETDGGTRYVAAADGLRALSILIIGWYHIWQQSWLAPYIRLGSFSFSLDPLLRAGYLFVDIMLLLSGFLLYLPIARGKSFDTERFFVRRALRILPSYYLSIALVLFLDALPNGLYWNAGAMWQDLLSHLTFTHVFFSASYVGTHLNVVLWTLAVEVHFYLIFPLVCRVMRKHPAITYLVMTGAAFCYRALVVRYAQDTTMLVNQLPGFLDVYANGMLCAMLYVKWRRLGKHNAYTRALASVLFLLTLTLLWALIRRQCVYGAQSYERLRAGQMILRYPLSLIGCTLIFFGANAGPCMRAVLGGRGMRFLAGVSFQFYIWHQYLAVKLRKWGVPASISDQPNVDSEVSWQIRYTLCAFGLALAVAVVLTYAFEKPIAHLGAKQYEKIVEKQRLKAAAKEEIGL